MNIFKITVVCALFSSSAYILAMQEEQKKILELSFRSTLSQETPHNLCHGIYPTYLSFHPETETLAKCDKNMQCNAYAAAIHRNSGKALTTLESSGIPIPAKNDLTFMMLHYALPLKSYSFGGSTPVIIPIEPKPEAIRWCLDHGADPNGNHTSISYIPLATPYSDAPRPHPLKHAACASNSSEPRKELLHLMRKKGASLDTDKSVECIALIKYVLDNRLCFFSHESLSTENIYNPLDRIAEARQASVISSIFDVYDKDQFILDADTAKEVKKIISTSYIHPYTKSELRKHLQSHTSEGIAAQERARQRVAFFKSLFSCGRSAKQVIPQSN